MYLRQAKQFMRNVDNTFDERRFGFGNLTDLMRACQREGLFRIERDRQGVIRLFPGNIMQPVADAGLPQPDVEGELDEETRGNRIEDTAPRPARDWAAAEPAAESEVVEGDVVPEIESAPVIDVEDAGQAEAPPVPASRTHSRGRTRSTGQSRARKTAEGAAASPRGRRTAAPRARTSRSRSRSKDTPSD